MAGMEPADAAGGPLQRRLWDAADTGGVGGPQRRRRIVACGRAQDGSARAAELRRLLAAALGERQGAVPASLLSPAITIL
jgi:hypothetical protein